MQLTCEVGGPGRRLWSSYPTITWSKIGADIPDGIFQEYRKLRWIINKQLDIIIELHIQIEMQSLPRSESLPSDGGGIYRCTMEASRRSGVYVTAFKDFVLDLGGLSSRNDYLQKIVKNTENQYTIDALA